MRLNVGATHVASTDLHYHRGFFQASSCAIFVPGYRHLPHAPSGYDEDGNLERAIPFMFSLGGPQCVHRL